MIIRNNKSITVVFFAVILVIIYGFINAYVTARKIIKNTKFTVATITSDWHQKNTRGLGVDYEYYVNNEKYKFVINFDLKKGDKYLLAYDSLKPGNCQFLSIYPLHSHTIAPQNGWSYNRIPIKINKRNVDEFIINNKSPF